MADIRDVSKPLAQARKPVAPAVTNASVLEVSLLAHNETLQPHATATDHYTATNDAASLPSRSAPAKAHAVHLRANMPARPMTLGARLAQLGRALVDTKPGRVLAVTVALAGFLATTSKLAESESIYLNLNGAATTSAEYVGAQRAAVAAHEAFVPIRPAQLQDVMARADAAHPLRKLIISGHSGGTWVSGSDAQGRNTMSLDEMAGLTTRYPKAAEQVEVFFAMACNIGTEAYSRAWMKLFLNSKALVGFDHIAPATTRPAAQDVLVRVDAELAQVDFTTLTRERAFALGARLSHLPGVKETEFSIRLRANDGTTVFYSKLNKPTEMTVQRDLTSTLRDNTLMPYLDARPGFEVLPTSHGPDSALRRYYNAAQDLLSAMARDAEQHQVANIEEDFAYKAVEVDKERALKLIYFPTILANAEAQLRPKIDNVSAELAAYGVQLTIPKLTTLTRRQIVDISNAAEFTRYYLSNWNARHARDVATVDGFFSAKGVDLKIAEITTAHPDSYALYAQQESIKRLGASDDVTAALQRLRDSLDPPHGYAAVQELKAFFSDALVDLRADKVPLDWVTNEPVPRG